MIKVEVVLDEEKLAAKYPLDKAWTAIDGAFVGHGIYKDGKGIYKGSGLSTDFAYFGLGIELLAAQEWFMDNVIKWY